MLRVFMFLCLMLVISSCGNDKSEDDKGNSTESKIKADDKSGLVQDDDVHSFSNVAMVRTKHIHLEMDVDFESKKISGVAKHEIEVIKSTDEIVFDIKGLNIEKVELDNGEVANFEIGQFDELLGAPLTVKIKEKTKSVNIYYSTTEKSDALQWLNPQQTAGKKYPYLFTQGQAILTRTWIPCQDTPGNRITYSADVKVPAYLMAVMSADNPQSKSVDGNYHFEMNNPIPSYLIAMAVGDLTFKDLGTRTGVYAEPSMLEKSANELVDMEKMVESAEGLYGEYKWGRYDVIVLPPSFPYGGMENPKLTFATPTILAGDKSLVSLIAHELAHSWSGNLVTNKTWDDFWLNEGFTTYFENRIMEEIYGKEYANMLALLSYQDLVSESGEMIEENHEHDTHLKLDLTNRDPEDGMTAIAYDKGAYFLRTLENVVGREKFDVFLKGYFDKHQFQTITTEEFIAYLDDNLLSPNEISFNYQEWIYEAGVPANCMQINSPKFELVERKLTAFNNGKSPASLGIKRSDWTTHEWLHFIRNLSDETTVEQMKALDEEFKFKSWGNSEIMAVWFVQSIDKGYHGADAEIEQFLTDVGRLKFLEPIYDALMKTEGGKEMASRVYTKARDNYHPVSFTTIDEILDWNI